MSKASRRLASATGMLVLTLLGGIGAARAEDVHVAVAANFTAAAKQLAAEFAAQSDHRALLSVGSTGKLYAQIAHGAPFQVFLAADQERPARAEREGLAVPGTRFTYATGRIVLYSREPAAIDPQHPRKALEQARRLAIANPRTAPYGRAAVQALERLGLYQPLAERLVTGENIAQTYQFVVTGNAPLGFVAQSQVSGETPGSTWLVPQALHDPIAQDAVLLAPGADSAAARAFLAFLRGPKARAVMAAYGYGHD